MTLRSVVVVFAVLLLVATWVVADGTSSPPVSADIKYGSLPPFLKESPEYDLLKDGETYGLKYVPIKAAKSVPEKLWVHKITRWIPSRDEKWAIDFARGLGLTNSPDRSGISWFSIGRLGRDGQFVIYENSPTRMRLEYCKASWADTKLEEFYLERNKKLKVKEMYEIGKKAVQQLGLWPSNMTTNYVCMDQVSMSAERDDLVRYREFSCSYGAVEDYPLYGAQQRFRFFLTVDCELVYLEVVDWRETARYALLPTKSVQQAFEELNQGYSVPLPRRVAGAEVSFIGICYYMGTPDMTYVYPSYALRLKSDKFDEVEVCVPAIDSKYFENPKRQVVVIREPEPEPERGNASKAHFGIFNYTAAVRDREDFYSPRTLFDFAMYVSSGKLQNNPGTNEWRLTERTDICCALVKDPVFRVDQAMTNVATITQLLDSQNGKTAVLGIKLWDEAGDTGESWLIASNVWLMAIRTNQCWMINSMAVDYEKAFSGDAFALATSMKTNGPAWLRRFVKDNGK